VSDSNEYTIGAEVSCNDGPCGELTRVVIDPVARVVTHLVVDPRQRHGLGRLVPIDLVDGSSQGIRLRCSTAEFDGLEEAEETRFLLDTDGETGYADGEVFSWPYYGLGAGLDGMGGLAGAGAPPAVTYDRLPMGEVDVRRGDHVYASDGNIGRIQGLVINPDDHHVTHVLLQEGHLWGKKEVAIPIGAVTDVTGDGVRLSLSRDQVRDLPSVQIAAGHAAGR
jgi:sporulation protein YlmC with PRC-barrel domain